MKATIGLVIALEGNNQPVTRENDHDPSYLADNISGGGVLTELSGNQNTYKADVVDAKDVLHKIAVPCPNFMQAGDMVSVVMDNDGCEIYYSNHSSGRDWSYPRCPEHTRKYTKLARIGIKQGLFWSCLIGILVALAQGQSMQLNVTGAIVFGVFLWSAIWVLFVRSRSARGHHKAAQAMAQEEAHAQTEFIQAHLAARTQRLKNAAVM